MEETENGRIGETAGASNPLHRFSVSPLLPLDLSLKDIQLQFSLRNMAKHPV